MFSKVATTDSMFTAVRQLKEAGCKIINEGNNSFVECLAYEGEDEVTLINCEPETAPLFYQLCQAMPDNPLLPTIYENIKKDEFSIVRMERLIALDHESIDPIDRSFLEVQAPRFVAYIRGESTDQEQWEMEKFNPMLKETACSILAVSQKVYSLSNGKSLPFCDLKPDNVFLRKTSSGNQLVFGDPLYPGSGINEENKKFMQEIYNRFGMTPLVNISKSQPQEFCQFST